MLAVLGLAVLGSLLLNAAPEDYEGKRVAGVQFEPSAQPLTFDQLMAMLPLRIGEPLHASDVRDAIQRLYRTGEYTDIAVDATLAGDGVTLKFVTKPAYFVGYFEVPGVSDPPNEGQLLVATKLTLGTAYEPSDTTAAVARIIDLLKRNGFYNASVAPTVATHDSTQEVHIEFRADPGDRAKFDGIMTTGDTLRPLESLIGSSGWKRFPGWLGWHQLTETRLQNGLENIRSWYPKHDHLLAQVTLKDLNYDAESNRVTPTVAIDPGPSVLVRIRGAKLSSGRLRSLLPIYEERSLDRDLLEEGSRDLAAYFQTQGYFDATANYQLATPPSGEQLIDYHVDLGVQHKIVKVEIHGNHYFDNDTLRERMSVIPASLVRYRHGRYSRAAMDRDLDAIRNLYRGNGFRDVEVSSRVLDDYNGNKAHIAIFIDIAEGPQWFVSKLTLEGVSEEIRPALMRLLHSTQGQPYSDLNIATDRDNVLDYYFNHGYPAAKFDFTAVPAGAAQRIDLKFIVTPGERVYVRDVVVDGLRRTRKDVVTDRISLRPGDPLSQSEINTSQRRLYDLGIFTRVDPAIQNPDGDEPTKYVLYSIEEAGRYSMNVGVGAEIGRIGGGTTSLDSPAGVTGFAPRFLFGISRLNFLGLGHTLSLQTLVSTLEQRALLTYVAPEFLAKSNLNLQFSGLFDESHDIRTFSARREEASIQLGQKLSRADTLLYRITYRNVNTIGTPLISSELIPLLAQPVHVVVPSMSFIRDKRDDPIDSHKGTYTSIDLALATSAFGSQIGFGRVVARNSSYYSLTKNVVLARTTDFGLIERYAGSPEIPLAERFFAGGAFSNRAFPDFQAGPRDPNTGFPIGGNALLMNTIELRFPLIGDNLGGVLFNDMGTVYSAVNKISLRFHQRDLQDFDYAVQGFGFGLRYRTPLGPVRVDFSLSPNTPRFFGCQGSINQLFQCGIPGSSVPQTVQRINMFQFHFSLGQAF
ncbi:MAG TPA: outer membrane protein assembly factor BamA [Bryobacteraceae bacterium]|nr:outer membrane protein assembly factor BamA [Bryobacteraceae bacterium]